MVARQNLEVYQGADFRKVFEFKNESAVLMDLTGYVFRGQVRQNYGDNPLIFSFEFTLRDQTIDTGLVDMLLPASATAAITISKEVTYKYDIEMVTDTGDTKRVLEGELKLKPEITK